MRENGKNKWDERENKSEFENVLRGTFWLVQVYCADWWKFFYFWY